MIKILEHTTNMGTVTYLYAPFVHLTVGTVEVSELIAVISLNSIKQLIFIMETR